MTQARKAALESIFTIPNEKHEVAIRWMKIRQRMMRAKTPEEYDTIGEEMDKVEQEAKRLGVELL